MAHLSAAFPYFPIWLAIVGTPQPGSGKSVLPQGGPADSPVAIAKAGIDTTITLGDWLRSHPGDSVTTESLRSNDVFSCRVAIARSTFAKRSTTRYASFHVLVPPGEELPKDTTRIAERICHLREIYLETEPMDSAAASALLDSIAAQLGRSEPGMKANEGSTEGYGWTSGRTWRTDGTTVVVAIAPPSGPATVKKSLSTRFISPRKLVMVAYAPGSAFQDHGSAAGRETDLQYFAGTRPDPPLTDADSAIAWSGLPSVAADLKVVLAALRLSTHEARTRAVDSALIRAFRKIRDTAASLPPTRRAAALLGAEMVRYEFVPFSQPNAEPEYNALYDSLHRIMHGPTVKFSHDEHTFTRAWLWEAYRLDSLGRTGRLAFVRLLQRGFRRDAECAEDVAYYRAIIDRGEAYLRRGNADPLVSYYVGAAYKSIFDLANSEPGLYVDKRPTKREGEVARVRAIPHFRVALTGLRQRSARRESWYYATRLLLGKPGRPWFFCLGDED